MEFIMRTELKPGQELEYERVHAIQPPEMSQTLRDAGVTSWRIWRDGVHLIHHVEVIDVAVMAEVLSASSVNAEWDRTVAPFLASAPDWSAGFAGHPLVWTLPAGTKDAEIQSL
jgi:L-rhamnose mutarotase